MPSKKISANTGNAPRATVQERWGEKPYFSLDHYLKKTFGEKIYKIALDGGMTCPNRDGTLDTRGCIFCSQGGSGDFAIKKTLCSVREQIDQGIDFLKCHSKDTGKHYIAYFQSFSNTYAPVSYLRPLYLEAIQDERIKVLSIATRPDCFSEDIFNLLEECHRQKPVWIELGLQTIHEKTATIIRRGYPLSVFEDTVRQLQKRHIPVIVHVILGLPGETTKDILETIHYLNELGIDGIKLQLLHVLKGTDLGHIYQNQFISSIDRQAENSAADAEKASFPANIRTFTQEEYVQLLLQCIGHLSPDIVIHRLTGDGPKDLLLAPRWSLNKRAVLNDIAHQLKKQGVYQGCFLPPK